MADSTASFKGTEPHSDWPEKIESLEELDRLPLLSVVKDAEGIEAVRIWGVGHSHAHWMDDSGTSTELVLPVTILSVPLRAPRWRNVKKVEEGTIRKWEPPRKGER